MTFDEVIEHFRNNTDISGTAVFLDDVEDTLKELQEEYAPTIEMTKEDKQSLLDLKSRATFYYFTQCVEKWQQNRIGLQMPYGSLTEDELMQAWLHPEIIKVVEE